MRVLDVGCGNGDLSRVVAALVGPKGEVVGIDRSEEVLASARAVPPHPASAPIRYQTADLSGELPDLGLFDAIVGRRVLMYLPNAPATLRRIAQLAGQARFWLFKSMRAPTYQLARGTFRCIGNATGWSGTPFLRRRVM